MGVIVIECTYCGSDSNRVYIHTVGLIVIECTYSGSDSNRVCIQ